MGTEQCAQGQPGFEGCKLVDQVQNNRAVLCGSDRLGTVLETFEQLSENVRDRKAVFGGV